MGDISSLIGVFRMQEVSKEVRANIIVKLGTMVNDTFASNITEPLVVELVQLLVPNHEIFSNPHYQKYLKAEPNYSGDTPDNTSKEV